MDVLSPRYSGAELVRLDHLLSRLNIARAVLHARLDLGLTQEELGREAGTKQSRVSEIEAMKGNPRLDTLDRIARALRLAVTLVPREGRFTSITGEFAAAGFYSKWAAQTPSEGLGRSTRLGHVSIEAIDRERGVA